MKNEYNRITRNLFHPPKSWRRWATRNYDNPTTYPTIRSKPSASGDIFFTLKTTLLFFILLHSSIVILNAQSLQKTVLASSGDTYLNNGTMVQWTLGELAVSNYETSAASLLEGFHHGPSADLSTAISDLVLDEEVLLSPVPASHFLNLSTTYRGELTYRMFDVIGHQRLVDNFEGQVRIDLSRLVPGVYWVELVTSEGRRGYYSFVKT